MPPKLTRSRRTSYPILDILLARLMHYFMAALAVTWELNPLP